MLTVIKAKKCKICKDTFMPFSTMTKTCHNYVCVLAYERQKSKKEKVKKYDDLKKADRQWKKDNKKLSDWIKEAQAVFNKNVRLRDVDEPCISCGLYDFEITYDPIGGKWDCGHYLGRGAYPELRFHPLNAHKQCKTCNGGSDKFSHKARTVGEKYRVNLINKIGLDKVEWLEGPHPAKQYRAEDLKIIIKWYKRANKRIEHGTI